MIVALAGSGRFAEQFVRATRELSVRGFVVNPPALPLQDLRLAGERPLTAGQLQLIEFSHFARIAAAERLVVVGDGHFGRATAREILWAFVNDIPVLGQWAARDWNRIADRLRRGEGQPEIAEQARRVLDAETPR